ncbi:MAG: dihydropteroate synthase, partial [Victivallaceae bacterium]
SNLPENMQHPENLRSGEIFDEVVDFLQRQSEYAGSRGVAPERIIWDPGIGFGKSAEQNLELIRRAGDLKKYGYKLLYGVSRKSFIGKLLNIPDPAKRIAGSVGVALQLLDCGVEAVRIHDYFETREAWKMFLLSRRR